MNAYPEKTRMEALRLFADGVRTVDIAERLGVPKRTITEWARKAGMSRPRTAYRPQQDHKNDVLRDFQSNGRSVVWLADVYGLTRQTVGRWIAEAGLSTRRNAIDIAAAQRLLRKFGSYQAVADVLGVTRQGVCAALARKASATSIVRKTSR